MTLLVWADARPVLVKYLETWKAKRLRSELISHRIDILKAIIEECRHLNHPQILPPLADIYDLMDGVSGIIQADSDLAAPEMFADTKRDLLQFAKDWCQIKSYELLDLLPSTQRRISSDDLSALKLATTSFVCHTCGKPITYPRILAHSCMSDWSYSVVPEQYKLLNSRPWSLGLKGIAFHDEACRLGRSIIKLSGRDPETTLWTDMDGVWFKCASDSVSHFNREPYPVAVPYETAV